MGEYDLFQIEVSKSYDMNAWHDDLRKCLLSAGLQEKQTVFLMSDTQIVKEAQLEVPVAQSSVGWTSSLMDMA